MFSASVAHMINVKRSLLFVQRIYNLMYKYTSTGRELLGLCFPYRGFSSMEILDFFFFLLDGVAQILS